MLGRSRPIRYVGCELDSSLFEFIGAVASTCYVRLRKGGCDMDETAQRTWEEDTKLALEVWNYYGGIGGNDKNKMIQIVT